MKKFIVNLKEKIVSWWKADGAIASWWKKKTSQEKMMFWAKTGLWCGVIGATNSLIVLLFQHPVGGRFWFHLLFGLGVNFLGIILNLSNYLVAEREILTKFIHSKWFKFCIVVYVYFIVLPFWKIPKNIFNWAKNSAKSAYMYLWVEYMSAKVLFKHYVFEKKE